MALENLSNQIKNMSALTNEVSQIMLEAVKKNFDAQGRPSWERLKNSTLKQRAKKGYTGKILQRTGLLKRSVIASYDSTSATVSTNLAYAAIQNYGGTISRSSLKSYIKAKTAGKTVKKPVKNKMSQWKIPARPFLVMDKKDEERINAIIVAFMLKNS